MNNLLIHILRLIIFILAQGLIFGRLEFGLGIHPMIYPLYILMLPFDIRPIILMIMALVVGIGVDFFMNTFGLHASAAVLVAYFRPELFRLFAPRDGYDILKEPTANEYGFKWFFYVAGITTLIHHLWFFLFEHFKLTDIFLVLQKTILSALVTMVIFIIIQILFFKKHKTV